MNKSAKSVSYPRGQSLTILAMMQPSTNQYWMDIKVIVHNVEETLPNILKMPSLLVKESPSHKTPFCSHLFIKNLIVPSKCCSHCTWFQNYQSCHNALTIFLHMAFPYLTSKSKQYIWPLLSCFLAMQIHTIQWGSIKKWNFNSWLLLCYTNYRYQDAMLHASPLVLIATRDVLFS